VCMLALLGSATSVHAQAPSLTRTESDPILTAQGRSLDPSIHDEAGLINGLRIVGDDFLYLVTSPLRPTLEGVAIAAGVGAGVGLVSLAVRDMRDAAGHHRLDLIGRYAAGCSPYGTSYDL